LDKGGGESIDGVDGCCGVSIIKGARLDHFPFYGLGECMLQAGAIVRLMLAAARTVAMGMYFSKGSTPQPKEDLILAFLHLFPLKRY